MPSRTSPRRSDPPRVCAADLLTAAAGAAIGLTFAAVACAAAFTRPLRRVLAGMKSVNAQGGLARVPVEGDDEFGELARGYNAMADTIDDRNRSLAAADQEKAELLRLIYPEAVAEKLRKGAEITAETVSNVTVAVVWIDGLDSIASALSVVEIRDRLNALLSALSTAAAAHGVEPVRSLGESYICVCGLSSPGLITPLARWLGRAPGASRWSSLRRTGRADLASVRHRVGRNRRAAADPRTLRLRYLGGARSVWRGTHSGNKARFREDRQHHAPAAVDVASNRVRRSKPRPGARSHPGSGPRSSATWRTRRNEQDHERRGRSALAVAADRRLPAGGGRPCR